ncbi:MAG: 23S rRNA (adenine(2030)-N(6))-methyltransferase RlmJ [Pseudomonadota bacterium]
MLSYQHAYHAGNPADVHKHGALVELLRLLTKKDRGISYLETHAGRGLYDLSSDEARKTGEAAEGVSLLARGEGAYADIIARVRAEHGEHAYPGSPLVALNSLREQDRVVLMEKHPQEHAALRRAVRRRGAEVHRRDGYEGARALAPLNPRRGLVLIDPSYEVKTEYAAAAQLARDLHTKWPEAAILVWYPLLPAARHEELLRLCADAEPLVDEVAFDLKGGKGMTGSGLMLLGAPYGAGDAFAAAFASGQPVLRRCA